MDLKKVFEINNNKVKTYQLIIELELYELYTKRFYLVEYTNNTELIFMTTNESKNNGIVINEEFIIIKNNKELLKELENSIFNKSAINSIPFYTQYFINFIDNRYKKLILNHLNSSINIDNVNELPKTDKTNLYSWLYCLENK